MPFNDIGFSNVCLSQRAGMWCTIDKAAIFTSLKSPTRGMWFFRDFPRYFPVLEITTVNNHVKKVLSTIYNIIHHIRKRANKEFWVYLIWTKFSVKYLVPILTKSSVLLTASNPFLKIQCCLLWLTLQL